MTAATPAAATAAQHCEISWFSALCDDGYEFLGVPDPMLQSSWEHCRNIVLTLVKLRAYQAEGIEAFILSGYPHAAKCDLFARHVSAHIAHGPLVL